MNRTTAALILSIAVLPSLVNGQPRKLPDVNASDSKSPENPVTGLVEELFRSGSNGGFKDSFAPLIGLPKAMPTKDVDISANRNGKNMDGLRCSVVYELDPATGENKPICIYLHRLKRTLRESDSRFYRLDLDGRLEKIIQHRGKYDENGTPIRGTSEKTDLDAHSPEVKKAFDAEMKVLRAWLKKQKKPSRKMPTAQPAAKTPATAR